MWSLAWALVWAWTCAYFKEIFFMSADVRKIFLVIFFQSDKRFFDIWWKGQMCSCPYTLELPETYASLFLHLASTRIHVLFLPATTRFHVQCLPSPWIFQRPHALSVLVLTLGLSETVCSPCSYPHLVPNSDHVLSLFLSSPWVYQRQCALPVPIHTLCLTVIMCSLCSCPHPGSTRDLMLSLFLPSPRVYQRPCSFPILASPWVYQSVK